MRPVAWFALFISLRLPWSETISELCPRRALKALLLQKIARLCSRRKATWSTLATTIENRQKAIAHVWVSLRQRL